MTRFKFVVAGLLCGTAIAAPAFAQDSAPPKPKAAPAAASDAAA